MLHATFLRAPLPFDAAAACMSTAEKVEGATTEGSSIEAVERWLACWGGLQLNDLHGFPLWDRQLHDLLRPRFNELCRLFVYYCNTAPQTEADLTPTALIGAPA